VDSGEFPKLAGDFERVDAGLLPPGFLVTGPMNCAMMGAAKRNGEFIAGPAAKRPRLHKSGQANRRILLGLLDGCGKR
jgi:hypothetical protein